MKIKVAPRTLEPRRKLTLSLKASLVERLDRYAEYLGGATDRVYVMEQVLEQFLAADSDFQRWLAVHHGDGVVGRQERRRGRREPEAARETLAATG